MCGRKGAGTLRGALELCVECRLAARGRREDGASRIVWTGPDLPFRFVLRVCGFVTCRFDSDTSLFPW